MEEKPDAAPFSWMTLLTAGILLVLGGLSMWLALAPAEGAWLGAAVALAIGFGRTGAAIGRSAVGRVALVAVPIVTIGTGMLLERHALEPFEATLILGDVPPAPAIVRLLAIAGGGAATAIAAAVVASVLIARSGVFPAPFGWLALPVLIGGALCAIARDLISATFAVMIGFAGLDSWLALTQFIGSVTVGGILIFVALVARSRMLVPASA